MEKAFHVQRVAAKIKATERSIDEAMTLAAELMVEMKSAQDGLELGPIVTDSAFAKLAETLADLAKARSSIVTTHKRLVKIYDVCDLRTVASTIITLNARTPEEAETAVEMAEAV